MSVRVKICGITTLGDAAAAVCAGADALGFLFYRASPRFVEPAVVAAIIHNLPPFIAKVGVFVDADPATVWRVAEECGLDTLQFHGAESPAYCAEFAPLKICKAFRVAGPEALDQLRSYKTDAWLLDSHVPGRLGGSGERFNWDLAEQAVQFGRPVILAGGLKPENVAEAVRKVQPYAVDVSSGVEISPGRKDPALVRDFIAAAKGSGA